MAFKITVKGDPSGFKSRTYECIVCGHAWRELVEGAPETIPCQKCGEKAELCLSTPGIAGFSIADKQTRADMLRKRSEEHSKKLMKRGGE